MRSCFVKKNSFCDLSEKNLAIFLKTKLKVLAISRQLMRADPAPHKQYSQPSATTKFGAEKKGLQQQFEGLKELKSYIFGLCLLRTELP